MNARNNNKQITNAEAERFTLGLGAMLRSKFDTLSPAQQLLLVGHRTSTRVGADGTIYATSGGIEWATITSAERENYASNLTPPDDASELTEG